MSVVRPVIIAILLNSVSWIAFAQDRTTAIDVSTATTGLIANKADFQQAIRRSKTIYVAVFHDPTHGIEGAPPSADVNKVIDALRALPFRVGDDNEILRDINHQLKDWGRFAIVSDAGRADLLLIIDRGVVAHVDMVCKDPMNHPEECARNIHRDGSVSVYSSTEKPGLIWRQPQPGALEDSGVALIPAFRKDIEKAAP